MSGLIAIVGRPNVGKSALFNRIAGRRIAIVHDQPGVTRDRVSAELEWEGRPYTLVDTGGIGLGRGEKSSDAILKAAVDQVDLAIESADAIVLVVNVREGLVPLDREVAARLRDSGKPVLVAVNKADHAGMEGGSVEFAPLGFDRLLPVSAIHGIGITELMEAALKHLPSWSPPDHTLPSSADSSTPLKLAIVGRPNVGKSSLVNALTRSERVIVNPTPGTTRDSVDVPFEVATDGVRQRYLLIDTAGMRKQRRIDDSIEFFSVKRSEDSIARCDLAILVLDAESGILEQDKKIAGKIVEERKACIVVVNKWDLVADSVTEARKEEIQRRRTKDPKRHQKGGRLSTLGEFGEWVQGQLFFLDYAPVIFTSALSGFHLDRLLEAVRYVAAQTRQRIPTALLNRTLNDAIEKRQPVSAQGHRLKFFYATQTGDAPPAFVLFVNRDELLSDQYQKYLAGELRRAFGFEGCPLVLRARPRPQSVKPIRKFDRAKPAPRPGRSRGSTRDKTRGRSGAKASSSRRKRR
jgi:GTP-binding protein